MTNGINNFHHIFINQKLFSPSPCIFNDYTLLYITVHYCTLLYITVHYCTFYFIHLYIMIWYIRYINYFIYISVCIYLLLNPIKNYIMRQSINYAIKNDSRINVYDLKGSDDVSLRNTWYMDYTSCCKLKPSQTML